MKISFNGLRMSLAGHFNELVCSIQPQPYERLTQEQKECLDYIRRDIAALLGCYDDDVKDDCDDLSDRCPLAEVLPEEQDNLDDYHKTGIGG